MRIDPEFIEDGEPARRPRRRMFVNVALVVTAAVYVLIGVVIRFRNIDETNARLFVDFWPVWTVGLAVITVLVVLARRWDDR